MSRTCGKHMAGYVLPAPQGSWLIEFWPFIINSSIFTWCGCILGWLWEATRISTAFLKSEHKDSDIVQLLKTIKCLYAEFLPIFIYWLHVQNSLWVYVDKSYPSDHHILQVWIGWLSFSWRQLVKCITFRRLSCGSRAKHLCIYRWWILHLILQSGINKIIFSKIKHHYAILYYPGSVGSYI